MMTFHSHVSSKMEHGKKRTVALGTLQNYSYASSEASDDSFCFEDSALRDVRHDDLASFQAHLRQTSNDQARRRTPPRMTGPALGHLKASERPRSSSTERARAIIESVKSTTPDALPRWETSPRSGSQGYGSQSSREASPIPLVRYANSLEGSEMGSENGSVSSPNSPRQYEPLVDNNHDPATQEVKQAAQSARLKASPHIPWHKAQNQIDKLEQSAKKWKERRGEDVSPKDSSPKSNKQVMFAPDEALEEHFEYSSASPASVQAPEVRRKSSLDQTKDARVFVAPVLKDDKIPSNRGKERGSCCAVDGCTPS